MDAETLDIDAYLNSILSSSVEFAPIECASSTCGQLFTPMRERQIYCCAKCKIKEDKKRYKQRYKDRYNPRNRLSDRICEYKNCKDIFTPAKYTQRFCSEKCRKASEQKRYQTKYADIIADKKKKIIVSEEMKTKYAEMAKERYRKRAEEDLKLYITTIIPRLEPQIKDLQLSDVFRCVKGIYFLYSQAELLYVGSTLKDVLDRVTHHKINNPDIEISHARYLEYANADILTLEKAFIYGYKPKYNGKKTEWAHKFLSEKGDTDDSSQLELQL